ncbi:MAG: thiamine phosphate synthase [Myxococcota bacterium]
MITDRKAVPAAGEGRVGPLLETMEAALSAAADGLVAVMVREKDLAGAALLALCSQLLPICRSRGAALLVNDRVDVAAAVGADGVHLPSAGLPPAEARSILGERALIGVSTHGVDDARRAAEGGADYVTFGPVFDTPSKRAYGAPVGTEDIGEAARITRPNRRRLRVYGLGGITSPDEARQVRAAGADGIACIRAVLAASDPAAAVRGLLDL